MQLKLKNCEGYDRIPQRILIDGINALIVPLSHLFSLIYNKCKIPEQWLIAKITPIHKKGSKNDIENYRPVASLCSTTKIFERLILNRINKLEAINKTNLAGKEQHGFTKGKSTATAGLVLQSLIARALDDDHLVLLASIDLSAAFDIVNIGLLLKRLRVIGLPEDIISLVRIWLKERLFYVKVNGEESYIKTTWNGIIQGSILGPILYAIFISPLFDIEKITCYADDKFPLVEDKQRSQLVLKMESKLERIILWLTQSGMVVNESKTDLCLFSKQDAHPLVICINGKYIISRRIMNILGVTFDSKLQWCDHIAIASNKALKALTAIRIIKKYFIKKELLQLITSNVLSILYYNSEIWHLPSLKADLKQKLISVSARAIKSCMFHPDRMTSYENIHKLNNRAMPNAIMLYKSAIQLFKLYNSNEHTYDWTLLNLNQILTSRQTHFSILKSNTTKVGLNILANRLSSINGLIPLLWLNSTLNTFKLHCKRLLVGG